MLKRKKTGKEKKCRKGGQRRRNTWTKKTLGSALTRNRLLEPAFRQPKTKLRELGKNVVGEWSTQ